MISSKKLPIIIAMKFHRVFINLTKFFLLISLKYDKLLYRENGMYSSVDSPKNNGMGSFIKLTDLHFTRSIDPSCLANPDAENSNILCSHKDGHIDIAVLEHSFLTSIGSVRNDTRYYCCTDDAINAGHYHEILVNIIKNPENQSIIPYLFA